MVEQIFLSQAISKAWESQTFALPNPSVGALILSSSLEVLALESHYKFGDSHAELNAFKEAFLTLSGAPLRQKLDSLSPKELWDFLATHHQGLFHQCTLFVTLEPCIHKGKTPSCAELISILRPKKVVFGAKDPTPRAKGGAEFLQQRGIEVVGGVCLQESLDLLYPFLTFLKKGNFTLFKIAQRLNGSYQNGQISNLASRIFTHNQRANADNLIVSGNTVRTDLPKLDTRLATQQNKVPKIQILTQTPTSTHSINASKIQICHSPSDLDWSGFQIIEGGYPLLELLFEKIDCFLLFVAPCFEGSNPYPLPRMELELLHSQVFYHSNKDVALWFKPKR